jgi:hypothetical protein
MDKIDKAQLKLEGRCIHCKEKLPQHLTDCEDHPKRDILRSLKRISGHFNDALKKIADRAESAEYRKQMEEMLTKIKKNNNV